MGIEIENSVDTMEVICFWLEYVQLKSKEKLMLSEAADYRVPCQATFSQSQQIWLEFPH